MSGTIRGFITASPNLVGPDPATFAPTTLVSAIQQYPHEAVTIQARLLAGDAPLLRSISSQPEHDEEPFQTSRSDRNISSAGYHQGQAMDPSNTGLSSLKSVADDQSGHYDLVQAPSDGAPYVTQTQCGGHASMFPNELVDQHLEEGTNNSYPELDRLLNQENNPYPDPDNLSQLFQSDYIFSDDAFTRPKPAGTDCFDNAGGSYRHEDKQDH